MICTPFTSQKTPIHIITGVIFKDISHTIIPYSSSTPLLYKFIFHVPMQTSIPKQNVTMNLCHTSFKNNINVCKLQESLATLQEYIQEMLVIEKKLFDPQEKINHNYTQPLMKRSIDFIGDTLEWCCNVATLSNLRDLSENELQVDNKINQLLDRKSVV